MKGIIVKRSFLGLPKGTKLYFDEGTRSYRRLDLYEDIAGHSYERYDGYIEISESMVKSNLGKYFEGPIEFDAVYKFKTEQMDEEKNVAAEVSQAVREEQELKVVAKAVSEDLANEAKLDKVLDEMVTDEAIAEVDAERDYDQAVEAAEKGSDELSDVPEVAKQPAEEQTPDTNAVVEEKTAGSGEDQVSPTNEVITGDSGDLYMMCHVCGKESLISHVDDDIAIYMPITSEARATFVCPNCGARMDLYYKGITKTEGDESEEENKS